MYAPSLFDLIKQMNVQFNYLFKYFITNIQSNYLLSNGPEGGIRFLAANSMSASSSLRRGESSSMGSSFVSDMYA